MLAVQELPGIGPAPGAVIAAGIGDITRFRPPGPAVLMGRADPAALRAPAEELGDLGRQHGLHRQLRAEPAVASRISGSCLS